MTRGAGRRRLPPASRRRRAGQLGEAVWLARAERPDLILLDLVMPRVDGFAALRRIKDDPTTRSIPVIVLSNLGSECDVTGAIEAGAAGFFIKCRLSLGDLVAETRKALAERRPS